ncbi:MAG: hypothetical protein IJL19_10895 [Clostridiales bacterium]|nr:hypothetical protein [Clostridiales bacterium]
MNALIPDEQIDLQELQKRTDIAVISDEIASREELIDSLRRYLMLPRKDRRFSDYYSVRLFGCNVPDMFSTVTIHSFKGITNKLYHLSAKHVTISCECKKPRKP